MHLLRYDSCVNYAGDGEMSTWVLILVMKYGLGTASYNNIAIDGFSSQQKCERAAKQVVDNGDYSRHMCIEVKK